jgi:hypothetical protein
MSNESQLRLPAGTRGFFPSPKRAGNRAVMAVIRESGYRNVYARWVPKMLTVEQKTAPKTSAHNFSSAVRKT